MAETAYVPAVRVPMFDETVAEAPAGSAPTLAVPTLVVPRWKVTSVAPEAWVPAFLTVADRVMASLSTGAPGDTVMPVIVRSGLGAGTPTTWNSATCPFGAPVLAVKDRRTSATLPLTGIVTVLPLEGLKA
ncbi:hypothetical protein GCM10020219_029610 [Nonomuraea dietziae]